MVGAISRDLQHADRLRVLYCAQPWDERGGGERGGGVVLQLGLMMGQYNLLVVASQQTAQSNSLRGLNTAQAI